MTEIGEKELICSAQAHCMIMHIIVKYIFIEMHGFKFDFNLQKAAQKQLNQLWIALPSLWLTLTKLSTQLVSNTR